MSEATRSAALAHAVAVAGADGINEVLTAARKFDAFIAGEAIDKPAAAPATKPPGAAGTKPAATKPAATKPAARKPAPVTEEDEAEEVAAAKTTRRVAAAAEEEAEGGEEGGEEVTLEAVESVITDLLGANMKKQAIALLAEFNAKSASKVPEESRAEFVQRASDLLLGS